MSPEECIAALDDSLADDGETPGEDVILRRPGSPDNDVTCRARVTALSTEQIIGGIAQTELNVVISPTQINNQPWPGGSSDSPVDQRIPKIGIDKMVARGAQKSVTFVDPRYIGDVLVRINLRIG
jgi:hypothetical protein